MTKRKALSQAGPPREPLPPWPERTGEVDYQVRFGLQDRDPGDNEPFRRQPEPRQ